MVTYLQNLKHWAGSPSEEPGRHHPLQLIEQRCARAKQNINTPPPPTTTTTTTNINNINGILDTG